MLNENISKNDVNNQVQIICAGYGRTGTTSLEHGLGYLGFSKIYSYFNLIKDGQLFNDWANIFSQKDPRKYLANHVRNFQVVSDFPICIYSESLIENFPNAKVILTVRDNESWAASMGSLYNFSIGNDWKLAVSLSKRLSIISDVFNEHVWPNIYMGGKLGDPNTAIKNYTRHKELIRSKVKPENLLEFNVKESWEPLIEFLDIPNKPNISFPHVNQGLNNIRWTAIKLAFRKF